MGKFKRVVSFTDKENKRFKIEVNIDYDREGVGRFTASGDCGNSLGQCLDSIKPKNEYQAKLVKLWKEYHLNDMNAGTEKQEELLKNAGEGLNYEQRKTFLDSHKIDGTPLTKLNWENINLLRSMIMTSIKRQSDRVGILVDDFERLKNADTDSWTHVRDTDMYRDIDVLTNGTNNIVLKRRRADKIDVYLGTQRSSYMRRIKKYFDAKIEAEQLVMTKHIDDLKEAQLETALFDVHPETGNPYQYGTEWLSSALPDDIEEIVDDVCDNIEEIEEEERACGTLVVDIKGCDDKELVDLIDEACDGDYNKLALALHLGMTVEGLREIEEETGYYGDCCYNAEGVIYYCGDEDEIKEAAEDYVKNTLWAFNASFLSSQTGIPQEAFEAMSKSCEDGNDGILAIVEKTVGLEDFTKAAIEADSVGHFLNGYDGTSDEVTYDGITYTICRA